MTGPSATKKNRPRSRRAGIAVLAFAAGAAILAYAQAPAPQQQQQPAAPAPAPAAPAQPPQGNVVGGLNFRNGAPLLDVIDLLAQELKINYVLDPAVKNGSTVVMNTYGVVHDLDLRQLLETILRMNNLTMVQVGNVYRIVPAANVSQLPITPTTESDPSKFPDDDHAVLNLVFLRYMTAAEMAKVLDPFKGEGAKITSYDPANLLIILDNSRNMKRTLELIGMFDSDTFAGQRVRAYEVKNGRPTDISKELENVFKAYSLSNSKNAAVQFVPLDRINTILAVAPNPGVFTEVESWLAKFDVPSRVTAGSVSNYVYHLKYQRAEVLGAAVGALYGIPVNYALSSMYNMAQPNTSYPAAGGIGGGGYGGYGMGGYGGGYGGYGSFGGGYGGYGSFGGGYGAPGYGGYGGGYGAPGYGGGYGGGGYGSPYNVQMQPQNQVAAPLSGGSATTATGGAATTAAGTPSTGAAADQTGMYLGAQSFGYDNPNRPRIVPNPFDNTVLVRCTPEQWDEIQGYLDKLDISPRQVLIEAKIYEVNLSGSFSAGLETFLRNRTSANRTLTGSVAKLSGADGPSLTLSAGTLVGQARELFATLNAQELSSRTKVLSSPNIIATDSIPAAITVGDSVPTLSSQSVNPGVTSGGNSLFTNTITNVSTGTGLNILARVNPSGIVTMTINQTVTAPVATNTSSIDSPSFSQRNVSTQVTVDDGDMIAIGGIIDETSTSASRGVPYLERIPGLNFLFGGHSSSKQRTELIVFLTPHVIYDTHHISDATEELKNQLKELKKDVRKMPPTGFKTQPPPNAAGPESTPATKTAPASDAAPAAN
jgi:general secretion pathway protein D